MQAPGLAVVLVGSRKDSETYVRSKKKGCEEAGIVSFGADLPEDVSQAELLQVVADYNANDAVHGILVQLPLPEHIDEQVRLRSFVAALLCPGLYLVHDGSLLYSRQVCDKTPVTVGGSCPSGICHAR